MYLTSSKCKVPLDEMAKLEARSRWHRAVVCLSRPQVSKRSKLFGCWHASRLLSQLPCLSSFCWTVNRLPYLWTCSGVVPQPEMVNLHTRTEVYNLCLNLDHHHEGIMSVTCQKDIKTIASFPGLPRLRFLNDCSTQKLSQKAWWL